MKAESKNKKTDGRHQSVLLRRLMARDVAEGEVDEREFHVADQEDDGPMLWEEHWPQGEQS